MRSTACPCPPCSILLCRIAAFNIRTHVTAHYTLIALSRTNNLPAENAAEEIEALIVIRGAAAVLSTHIQSIKISTNRNFSYHRYLFPPMVIMIIRIFCTQHNFSQCQRCGRSSGSRCQCTATSAPVSIADRGWRLVFGWEPRRVLPPEGSQRVVCGQMGFLPSGPP